MLKKIVADFHEKGEDVIIGKVAIWTLFHLPD